MGGSAGAFYLPPSTPTRLRRTLPSMASLTGFLGVFEIGAIKPTMGAYWSLRQCQLDSRRSLFSVSDHDLASAGATSAATRSKFSAVRPSRTPGNRAQKTASANGYTSCSASNRSTTSAGRPTSIPRRSSSASPLKACPPALAITRATDRATREDRPCWPDRLSVICGPSRTCHIGSREPRARPRPRFSLTGTNG